MAVVERFEGPFIACDKVLPCQATFRFSAGSYQENTQTLFICLWSGSGLGRVKRAGRYGKGRGKKNKDTRDEQEVFVCISGDKLGPFRFLVLTEAYLVFQDLD